MLPESQLYTFIDQEKKFALYFLEGQKLIHDLVLTHHLKKGGFSYFRSAVLGVQLMLALLKKGEYFCFYIDAESPYFRLKIEMNAMGLMRGVLYPENLASEPESIQGIARLVKFLPHAESPYQSTLDLRDVSLDEIINLVLSRSYQVESRVELAQVSDQSFMLHQLPLISREDPSDIEEAFRQYQEPLNQFMARGLSTLEDIQQELTHMGFKYLAHRPVQFSCGCSKTQMITNVQSYAKTSNEDIFLPGENSLQVICEYCKTAYQITVTDIEERSAAPS
ncbi:MAG: Hsp33 family molecular chaperone HslO [SAR324 cluster bacterium]|nr:Hsp33 family molecular chaperone HslO [SAR324 cluster bacterium]